MNDTQRLHTIVRRGLEHLGSIVFALDRIEKENKDPKDLDKQKLLLITVFRALNDVLHSSYDIAPELFEDKDISSFVDQLKKDHKEARDKNLFPKCECFACKESDESSARSTDKAESV